MTVTQLQEQALERRATESGQAQDWVFYLAARRDWDRLAAWRERIAEADRAGWFAWEVAWLARDPQGTDRLLDRIESNADSWVLYTLVKVLLGQRRLKDALRLVYMRLEADRHDVGLLNLVAKHLVAQQEWGLAKELIPWIQRLNPHQEDIAALLGLAESQHRLSYPLYLDPLPMAQDVVFYLPVYNVERYIRQAIEGILGQNFPIAEILVIDDGSIDGSITIAEAYPVRIVRHETNRGLAAARNTAFRHARSRFVGAVDTDAWPSSDFTRTILMEFENADPRMCGGGGRLIEVNQTEPADRWRAKYLAQQQGPLRKCTPDGLFGSNTMFLREAILDVGSYDEKYRTNAEDIGICRALRQVGRWFFYTPYAIAYHGRTDTVASVLKTMWNWVYPGKLEAGTFDDPFKVLLDMHRLREASEAFLKNDLRLGHHDSLYIDVVCLFHLAFSDLGTAASRGTIRPEEARYLQEGMLEPLRSFEQRGAAGLFERVRNDVASLFQEAPSRADAVRGEFLVWLPQFQAELATVYDRLPSHILPHLARSAR